MALTMKEIFYLDDLAQGYTSVEFLFVAPALPTVGAVGSPPKLLVVK